MGSTREGRSVQETKKEERIDEEYREPTGDARPCRDSNSSREVGRTLNPKIPISSMEGKEKTKFPGEEPRREKAGEIRQEKKKKRRREKGFLRREFETGMSPTECATIRITGHQEK